MQRWEEVGWVNPVASLMIVDYNKTTDRDKAVLSPNTVRWDVTNLCHLLIFPLIIRGMEGERIEK